MKPHIFLSLLCLVTGLAAQPTLSRAEDSFCLDKKLESVPILTEGRIMPLRVHAKHVRSSIFAPKTCNTLRPVAFYCLLSTEGVAAIESRYSCEIKLKIAHQSTATLLGLPEKEKSVPIQTADSARNQIAGAYQQLQQKHEEQGGYGTDLASLLSHLQSIESITAGTDWKVLSSDGKWADFRSLPAENRLNALIASAARLSPADQSSLSWEMAYEKSVPFHTAVLFCLVGFLFSMFPVRSRKWAWVATVNLVLLIGVESFGILARMIVSGRSPVTNMYETVLWTGLGIFALGAILGMRFKDKRLWAAGYAGNAICLFMMGMSDRTLDASIQPLVPVLRNNFWLSTHVMTVTWSYSCFGLTWFLGNLILLKHIFKGMARDKLEQWNKVIRLALLVGVIFLAAGILLGGIWADYAWGRFWGWDPKETWSLIALILYSVILHGKHIGWFKGIQFTIASTFGFLSIMMAWFGVNYILASGLHSYGFSSGGAAMLSVFFIGQIAILCVALFRRTKKER